MSERRYSKPKPHWLNGHVITALLSWLPLVAVQWYRASAGALLMARGGLWEARAIGLGVTGADLTFMVRVVLQRRVAPEQRSRTAKFGMVFGIVASLVLSMLLTLDSESNHIPRVTDFWGVMLVGAVSVLLEVLAWTLTTTMAEYINEYEAALAAWQEGATQWENRQIARKEAKDAPQELEPAPQLRGRLAPSARRDAMAEMLARDPALTAVQLAQAFGVSRRTAETDLAAVRNNNHGGAQ